MANSVKRKLSYENMSDSLTRKKAQLENLHKSPGKINLY